MRRCRHRDGGTGAPSRSGVGRRHVEINRLRSGLEHSSECLAGLRAETLEEIRLYELRHSEAIREAELAGRLDVIAGAISKLEHSDDVRVSTPRQYLEVLGPQAADPLGRDDAA